MRSQMAAMKYDELEIEKTLVEMCSYLENFSEKQLALPVKLTS